ncbi:histidine phosphatase family protein [Streptomyces lushanensis]|uniref:histidine phosphatase family protein n=1 Tax=Streptomyces lushanensis TaxID=1434255 RepID=UPI000833FDDE|nr:histidine phosphatase family protein [Streptomyces lushanensis]
MTTRVMLISPAISTALREARFPASTDLGAAEPTPDTGQDSASDALDPLGLRQAEAVRETFPRATALYVSPSHRCRRTAEILGLDAKPLSDLAPCAMGRWQRRTLDEVAAEEPESVAAWLSDPASAPHGGESLLTLHTRVGHWLDNLGSGSGSGEDPGARVVAVAEPDIIRAAAVHALGASPGSFWRIDVLPLSLTELSGRTGRWNLLGGRPLHTHTAAP